MKRILSILGTITLIGTSTTSLVACNTPQYTEEQLKELKEKNSKIINNNKLEGMAPQDKPFNKVDNKGYFVIWRGNKNDNGKIANFQNNEKIIPTKEKQNIFKNIDEKNENKLKLSYHGNLYAGKITSIDVDLNVYEPSVFTYGPGRIDRGTYFKAVYRGESEGEPKTLNIDSKTGKIIDGK